MTTFGVGEALRLQCAGGAFCLIGLPLTVHGGWEALGKISVISAAGAAATSPCDSEPWQDDP